MTKDELIEAFELGGMGEVEFFELALDAGIDLDEVATIMQQSRED